MTPIRLRGMAWGHRRATGPLGPITDQYKNTHPDVTIEWSVRPLSDFEHQGIEEVAKAFDLIIYDHPFSGNIVTSGAFLPLERHVDALAPTNGPQFIGPTLASYWFEGQVWGVPIDGATQHALYRADLMDEVLPKSWEGVLSLGARLRRRGLFLAQAFETPHTILSAGSLMANLGLPWTSDPDGTLTIDRKGLIEALKLLTACFDFCPAQALGWNSIDVHDQMVGRDDLAYAPCVYGFATYGEADVGKRLSFAPFPGPKAPHAAGSAIGGTAVGISSYCQNPEVAIDFVRFLSTPSVQIEAVTAHHGQPALAAAWHNEALDRAYNGYYSATRESLETAWVRPRCAGYPTFQRRAGIVARAAISGELGLQTAVDQIISLSKSMTNDTKH